MVGLNRLRLSVDHKGGNSHIGTMFNMVGVECGRFEETLLGKD